MADFHFIRPWWLLAIFALMVAIYLLKKLKISQSGWEQIIPKHLANVLITTDNDSNKTIATAQNSNKKNSANKPLTLTMPFIIGLLSIIALAGPTWQKLPQPVFKMARGSVLIMDMSYSMYATDIVPNRLTRARYKAIDLLDSLNEGDIGLVAYAGDAFIISPLTEDINNIKLLLPSLTPDIMPELGSNPLAALIMADEMLKNSGHIKGDIYWFTDGVDNEDLADITQWTKDHAHNLHILGIGTLNGAPIKLTNGQLLKDNTGAIVIPHLTQGALTGLATKGHGNYQTIRNDNKDIDVLLKKNIIDKEQAKKQQKNTQLGDQWQELGPYLIVLILPLLLGYFRRGNIIMLLPLTLLLLPNEHANAGIWQDLWHTKNQQAQQNFNQKKYAQAAKQFDQPLWQGSAHYKAGDYQQALTAFQQSDSAQALYNQGNALAKLQKFEQAIKAYQQALAKNPNLADAKKNKKIVEDLKKQQDRQKQKQKQKQKKDQDNKKSSKQKQQDQQKNQQSKDQSSKDKNSQNKKNKDQKSQPSDQQKSADQKAQDQEKSKQKGKKDQQQNSAKNQAKENKKKANKQPDQEKSKQKGKDKQQALSAKEKSAQDQRNKEAQQKYQQLLNKVTDDPYLLLRNKMQLEYQKRHDRGVNRGAKKTW